VRRTNLRPEDFTLTNATVALAELAEKGVDIDAACQA
jgi:hypothetical protein